MFEKYSSKEMIVIDEVNETLDGFKRHLGNEMDSFQDNLVNLV